jgi:hypothetical protein
VIRVGWLGFRQHDRWNGDEPSWGVSPLDCAQIFTKAIDVPSETLHFGLSDTRTANPLPSHVHLLEQPSW